MCMCMHMHMCMHIHMDMDMEEDVDCPTATLLKKFLIAPRLVSFFLDASESST